MCRRYPTMGKKQNKNKTKQNKKACNSKNKTKQQTKQNKKINKKHSKRSINRIRGKFLNAVTCFMEQIQDDLTNLLQEKLERHWRTAEQQWHVEDVQKDIE